METLETEKFFSDGKPLLKPISDHSGVISVLLQPYQWLQMLCSRLNLSFVLGVVLVYGVNQGFSGSIFKVVTDYYWKDVQQVQPSVVQLYMGLYYIPWVMRPIWGLCTDVFPIKGYKRKPYFVVSGVLGLVSAIAIVVLGKLPAALALSCLLGVSAAMAIADVVIDACIATNSINIRSLAPDIQSLCMVCSSAGALVGYATSGVFVHQLGPQVEPLNLWLLIYTFSGHIPFRYIILKLRFFVFCSSKRFCVLCDIGSIRGISIFTCNYCHTWVFHLREKVFYCSYAENQEGDTSACNSTPLISSHNS